MTQSFDHLGVDGYMDRLMERGKRDTSICEKYTEIEIDKHRLDIQIAVQAHTDTEEMCRKMFI